MSSGINFGYEALRVSQFNYNKILDRQNCEQTTLFEIDDLLEKMQGPGNDLGLPRSMLEMCRNHVVQNEAQRLAEAVMGKKGVSFLNMAHEGPVALSCPGLPPHFRLPMVGFYGDGYLLQIPLSCMRIHSLFLDRIPASIKNVLSWEQIAKCDFIFNAAHVWHMEGPARTLGKYPRYNFVTHCWVHPRAQKGDDIKEFPSMGIFEPINVNEIKGTDGISFGSLKPMEVYFHPVGQSTAISPNNAHFAVREGAPFSAFWHVTVCKERTLITRQLMINNDTHPLAEALERSLGDTDCVSSHLSALKFQKVEAIEKASERLRSIALAFEQGNEVEALVLFNKLSQGEKNRVFLLTYIQMGEPRNIHSDFGRASFYGTIGQQEYRCSPQQKAKILRQLLQEQISTFEQMIEEQESLFTAPKAYPQLSPERARKEKLFRPILEKFKSGNSQGAMEQFSTLPKSDQGKVFEMAWDLKNCPIKIHWDFGMASFLRWKDLDEQHHCSDRDRIDAINLYLHQ